MSTANAEALDPGLWEAALSAAVAAAAAAEEYLSGGGICSHVALPKVGRFDSGWPQITSAPLLPRSGPLQLSSLFGPKDGTFTKLPIEEIPAFKELETYVRSRPLLWDRLAIPNTQADDEFFGDSWAQHQVALLPRALLDRANALGISLGTDALPIYCELERGWLLDPLPVEYIVPLALTAFEAESDLQIDEHLRLVKLDDAMQAARAPSPSPISSVPDPVISAATHALVLADYEIPNPGPGTRFITRDVPSVPLQEIDLVLQALRVITEVDVGYAQVLVRPVGWADRWKHDLPAVSQVQTVRRYPDHLDDYGWLKTGTAVTDDELRRLPMTLSALRVAEPRVQLACRRLSLAAMRQADDDRTIDACIGLESLLGEGRDELTHRLALRSAAALATRPDRPLNPEVVYDLVKAVYGHRSSVVHGTTGDKWRYVKYHGAVWSTDAVAVLLLRLLLQDVLARPEPWGPRDLDKLLLQGLVRPTTADESATGDAT